MYIYTYIHIHKHIHIYIQEACGYSATAKCPCPWLHETSGRRSYSRRYLQAFDTTDSKATSRAQLLAKMR